MAEHYGIACDVDHSFQRVDLPKESPRGGVFTQASVLKVTANGTVTSPVRRGAFVLTRLLSSPPSPPPPGVGSIEPDTRGATTVREQLAKHRSDAACARCHDKIDPPGFALESFDAIGGYRQRYRSTGDGERVKDKQLNGRNIWEYKYGPAVDPSGVDVHAGEFADIRDFKKRLMERPNLIAKGFASQLITYATGHGIDVCDEAELNRIVVAIAKSDSPYGIQDLIHEIVQSPLFRRR
ncbi:MAG: DUF1588 domain-containing protein [Planctomycetota bacterium]